MRKRFSLLISVQILIVLAVQPIVADGFEDISFQLVPGLEIPIGEKSSLFTENALYSLGGSAMLKGQYIFPRLPLLFLDGRISFALQPTQAALLSLISGGIGTGLNMRIGNIMSLQAGAEAGWYVGLYEDFEPASNPYFGGSAAFAWDFSPAFSLSSGVGYRYYLVSCPVNKAN